MTAGALDAAWAFAVGGLAVLYAITGDGWPPRRAAIAFMMGSWGARLAIHLLYSRREQRIPVPSLRAIAWRAAAAVAGSVPAFIASRTAIEGFSPVELVAAGTWVVAFTGEVGSDRRPLRRLAFEFAIWIAFIAFAMARVVL